jgi:hypothetical protein
MQEAFLWARFVDLLYRLAIRGRRQVAGTAAHFYAIFTPLAVSCLSGMLNAMPSNHAQGTP